MEVCGSSKLECKHEVRYFIMKAYVLSLFFLVVVLYLAVGDDAWTQYAELLLHSVSARSSRYTYYYLDLGFSP